MNRRNAASAVAALAFASPAWAGLVITSTEQHDRSSVTYLEGKKLRMERPLHQDEEAHVTIFDGDTHQFVEIDPAKRTYRVMTEEQGKEVSAQLQKMLAQLPPEQRARAEAALAKRRETTPKQHDIRFESLGSSDVVAGHACQRYRVMRDGKSDEEGCFSPWNSGTATREDLAAFVEMGRFLEGFAANMGGAVQPGAGRWLSEELTRAPGFPMVLERIDDGGKRTLVHRVVKLERRRVPAELFTIPAGYAEVKSPFLEDAPMRRARRP